LSQEVKIGKRVVVSLPSLLGDTGGLHEILSSFIFLFIGQLQAKAYIFNQVQTFFRTNWGTSSKSRIENAPVDVFKGRTQFVKLKLD